MSTMRAAAVSTVPSNVVFGICAYANWQYIAAAAAASVFMRTVPATSLASIAAIALPAHM